MRRVRVVVRGLVQGVYFRAETERLARSRGVAGWVRNVPDGSVEAVFEGEDGAVERMVEWCRRGPRGARVDAVEVSREEPRGERGFRVAG